MPVITAVDVVGIQRFVFASNRLKDVVSGSWLVHWSTTKDGALKDLVEEQQVLVAAGGNAILEFNTLDHARSFACRYTRRLHHEAPGLEVALVHREYQEGELADALLKVQVDLARLKMEPRVSSPLLGLSVTASCQETGLPAVGFDARGSTIPLGRGVLKRRQAVNNATQQWKSYIEDSRFQFPLELDQLGRIKGESSFIGIVHIDGNGVGARIKEWLDERCDEGTSDQWVRSGYREWSEAMNQLADRVFKAIVRRVSCAITRDENRGCEIKGRPDSLEFPLVRDGNGCYLPLRPILVAGDDITFACDGRIALDLSETALSEFPKGDVPHLGKITACAGVAIVPVHYPFYRAYEMAEGLCSNAKAHLRQKIQQESDKYHEESAMDWHIGVAPLGQPVRDFRKELYGRDRFSLTCRPYLLGDVESQETWMWLSRGLLDGRKTGLRGQAWAAHRNKAKKLGELVWEGPDAITKTLGCWRVAFPTLILPQEIEEDGFFSKNRTPLLDAVELLDLHLVLEGGDNENTLEVEQEMIP